MRANHTQKPGQQYDLGQIHSSMMNTNQEIKDNNINGSESPGDNPSSGRCSVHEQRRPGCHFATAQMSKARKGLQWTIEENKEIMLSY